MSEKAIIAKVWNFATILRDSGVSYTKYVGQLSYLLFLKMESERFCAFDIREIRKRDKMNLDIFWLKSENLEDLENLPSPKELSEKICLSLKNALKEMEGLGVE